MTPRALALAFSRCHACGEPCGELVGGAWCLECCGEWERGGLMLADPIPIEPLTPIEPSKSRPIFVEADGSMGVLSPPDGSVGVTVDATAARLRALDIDAGPDLARPEPFSCVLPGHDDAARVHSTSRAFWHYECGDVSLGLAEVRACVAYGAVKRVSRVEAARWRERLDYDAGLLAARDVGLPLPDVAADSTLKVGERLRLFLGLRDERWAGQPFTWARNFVMAYCDVTDSQAREAVWQLRQAGALTQAGKSGRAILYRAGGRFAGDAS
jgi:hypothetical protein